MHQQFEPKNTGHKTQSTDEERPLTSVKVLLVEDEFDVAELLLFILQDAGAEVVWLAQATEVLPELHQQDPDILISDIKLPDYDGTWLIQQIRRAETQTCGHLPAIAVTCYTREVSEQRMLDAGFERFITKFEFDQLVPTILKLIESSSE